MLRRWRTVRRHGRRLAREEGGFTMIEVVAAVVVVAGGIMALAAAFGPSKDAISDSELRQAASHRAQREIEAIQSLDYPAVAHPEGSQFTPSDDPESPDYLLRTEPEPSFQWDENDPSRVEPLVVEAGGTVEHGPSDWQDGRFNGKVYRYVTWASDPACAGSDTCPDSRNFKRVTVAVTVRGFAEKPRPVFVSTIVTDPDAGATDGATSPQTECVDDSGNLVTCSTSVPDDVMSLFFHDTPATSDARQEITASHPTHPTVAPTGPCTASDSTGCPVPDLLTDTAPPASDPPPPLFGYSNDVAPAVDGGRVIRRDVSCSDAPSRDDNTKGGLWTTGALPADAVLTGKGGMSLFTYAIAADAPAVTLCLAFYDVAGTVGTANAKATELGRASYALPSWPTAATQVSFSFDFLGDSPDPTVPAGHRIGVRMWPSSSSTADVAVLYDHQAYPSAIQINAKGS